MNRTLGLALLLAIAACRTPVATAPEPSDTKSDIRLTLVGSNDFHGWLEPKVTKLPSGQTFEWGGAGILSGYVKNLRRANPGGVLLLDAGDLFQGTLVANVTEGRAMIDAFNQLQYTAVAVGNHEFDYGPEGPAPMATRPEELPFGALAARIREARFPILSSNIFELASGKRPDWLIHGGTLLVEAKGIKVGIIALTTPQTPFTTNPANVALLRFGPLATAALGGAKALRAQGAELIVVVAHAGGKCAKVGPPEDLSSCDQDHGEIFQMLNALPEGTIDAVIAGHVHTRLGHYVHGTPVISTSGMGKHFGVIDLFVDPKTHRVAHSEIRAQIPLCLHTDANGSCDPSVLENEPQAVAQPVEFEGAKVEADPAVAEVLKPHVEQVRKAQEKQLGIDIPVALARNYEAESGIGDMLVDSLRLMERADFAVMNSGGFRADLPAGPLDYGHIYELLPFDNAVANATLTGDQLFKLLDAAYGARKGVYQVSGLIVTLGPCAGPGRLKSVTLSNGSPLVPGKKYRVAMPDFLARGGDGLAAVMALVPSDQVDLGLTRPLNLRDSLVEYWREQGRPLVAPAKGRIRFLADPTPCK